ncbi:MAG: response regulator transcription factor [Oscillospiraceae bacterium]|nr:response regulator transcription factor [Oscillospiraceae bacterium]
MPKIYIVEDDKHIRELVVYALNSNGFEASGFESVALFDTKLNSDGNPDLVLLDIMLPGEDGIECLTRIRAKIETEHLPVIMLTAKSSEYDKIFGLDKGADDYITKPFSVLELISRIKAVLRRAGKPTDNTAHNKSEVITCDGVVIDVLQHSVKSNGTELTLTLKEFELLKYLVTNRGIVLSRDKLSEYVWGYNYGDESRTVDMHIKTLRKKLGENGTLIETIRGVGYRFKPQKEEVK